MTKRWLTHDLQLFSGKPQADNFRNFIAVYPVRVVCRSRSPRTLARAAQSALPESYDFAGEVRRVDAFFADTETTGLVVLRDDAVVQTWFREPLARNIAWPCWSITKSFVSTLIGIAIDKGYIAGVDVRVSDIAPQLSGSSYDGVRLFDVLTMSSGARWYENYSDPASDTRRHGLVHATGGSLDAFSATLPREWEPGVRMRYNSIDTNVLGQVLRRSTKRGLATLMHDWLWEPLHCEHDGYFAIDGEGAEWAGAGFICTLEDRARLGALFCGSGEWEGTRIVSEAWVRSATSANAPHLTCSACAASPFGYGFQWWLHGDAFCAIGIYNQYVWVDPARRVVIAKASANRNFGRSYDEAGYRDQEHMALFEAIARSVLA